MTPAERARLRASARAYRRTEAHLTRMLNQLREARARGEDDPEDREAAASWAMQADHASREADRLELLLKYGG